MNGALFLSRARLRHDAPNEAFRAAFSRFANARIAAAHRLIWTLFGDTAERRRDFLWREAEPGTFYLLSARPPEPNELFNLDPARTFEPVLNPGDRLRFALRANATIARKSSGAAINDRVRGKRCDIVMDAIHNVPRDQRARVRREVLPDVAARWLSRQGEIHGFKLADRECTDAWEFGGAQTSQEQIEVTGYRVLRLGRTRGQKPLQLGVLDLEGTLIVEDPHRFVPALAQGFGRGKAFGCGLMLIRRDR